MISGSDIFIIPGRHEDEYIIYAPIKGIIFLASAVAANKINESLSTGTWPNSLRSASIALSRPDIFEPNDRFDRYSEFEPVGLMIELIQIATLGVHTAMLMEGLSPPTLSGVLLAQLST